jgi:hypothetical protein
MTQITDRFRTMFPKATELGLHPVSSGGDSQHHGFDSEEVEKALGSDRYKRLMAGVTNVFVCGHRSNDQGHEVHCIYAADLKRFLESESEGQ